MLKPTAAPRLAVSMISPDPTIVAEMITLGPKYLIVDDQLEGGSSVELSGWVYRSASSFKELSANLFIDLGKIDIYTLSYHTLDKFYLSALSH